ncbi:MAG: hypothetical protein RLZZ540_2052 [Bacteroidota bacterium]|jgi:CheY-like chemotaxis protein
MKLKHVLLIDDNDIDNYVNNHIVTKSKIAEKITIKKSAIAALDFLKSIGENDVAFPDLIFLDISMPIMDGFGFLEEIIKFPNTIEKQCAVVMLSSSDNPNDIKRAMNFEVVIDFFTKPLRIEMIEKLVEKGNL